MLAGAEWLIPLYDRLHELLLQRDILHADETSLQVLHEPGREATSKSYMWLYRTGRGGPPIVLYEYQQTRAREHPKAFFNGFAGRLHADAYAGYDGLPGITISGCWAHARRYFDEALKSQPPRAKGAPPTVGEEGLAFCNKLFEIERDVTPEERHVGRKQKSRPVINAFKMWLARQAERMLPKSALGKAVTYCQNQWAKLLVYLEDGRLEIDNNRAERSIKPFVIGRKNWLFANTPRGAKASAIIYSIIESAKENNLNPYAYLTHLFEQLPNCTTAELDALLRTPPPCQMAAGCLLRLKYRILVGLSVAWMWGGFDGYLFGITCTKCGDSHPGGDICASEL